MACVNGDGTEKIILVSIEKLKVPKCFKVKTDSKLGFNYHANSKTWINFGIFLTGLQNLIHVLGALEAEMHF